MKKENWWEVLQPLRIPAGWHIEFNKLICTEPQTIDKDDERWFDFTEDIAYIYTVRQRKKDHKIQTQKLGIDLGWYPDCNPNGKFCLQAVLNDDWENPLQKFFSKSTKEVIKRWEKWLFCDFYGFYWITRK